MSNREVCPKCKGNGRVTVEFNNDPTLSPWQRGQQNEKATCYKCQGTGIIQQEEPEYESREERLERIKKASHARARGK